MSYERAGSLGGIGNAFSGFQAQQFAHAQQQQQQHQQSVAAAYAQQQQQMRQQRLDQQDHEQQTRPDMSEFPSLGSPPGLTSASATPQPLSGQLYRTIAGARADRQLVSNGPLAPTPDDFPALSGASEHEGVLAGNSTLGAPGTNPEMAGVAKTDIQLIPKPVGLDGVQEKLSMYRQAGTNPAKLGGDSAQAPSDPADRYGMLGILTTNDYGFDVSKFGLPLPSSGPLYSTFGSPWADQSQVYGLIEPDYKLPSCYNACNPPLAMTKIPSVTDETLFYIFYTMPRDELQLAAAEELYRRQWRYHKELRLWLTKDPDSQPIARTPRGEQGVFIFFDPGVWQKIKKEFLVLYEMLEDRGALSAGTGIRSGTQSVSASLQQQQSLLSGGQQTVASGNAGSADLDSSAAAQAQLQSALRFNSTTPGSQQQQQPQQQLAMLRLRQQESIQAAANSRAMVGQADYSSASIGSGMYSSTMAGVRGMGTPHIEGTAAPSSSSASAPASATNIAEDVATASMA
ncbi:transcriptional regulator [Coemansia sp. RSA 1843]|nr:transcriptional regulator [Coemansia sp. RSA 1843]